ncbi:MAG: hypothetical protein K2G83_08185, partial [Ruminococcus sp.]|nr:hypothetical protein [Ruminococcus sp.]
MSDRKNSNNTDNQNTRTTYIPPEAREQYRQVYQNQQPRQNPPQYHNPTPNQSPPQYQPSLIHISEPTRQLRIWVSGV